MLLRRMGDMVNVRLDLGVLRNCRTGQAVYTDMEHRRPIVVVRQVVIEHIGNDDLERYLLRALPPSEMARGAEHLQVCNECRERLVTTDEFVSAIRAALRILKSRESRVEMLCSDPSLGKSNPALSSGSSRPGIPWRDLQEAIRTSCASCPTVKRRHGLQTLELRRVPVHIVIPCTKQMTYIMF